MGLRKRRSCSSAHSWEEAAAAGAGMETATASPSLFASKTVPAMKASCFFCSNTADQATSGHRKSGSGELQLGPVPCGSAVVTVPRCWTAPALPAAGRDVTPRQGLQRSMANAEDVTAEGV